VGSFQSLGLQEVQTTFINKAYGCVRVGVGTSCSETVVSAEMCASFMVP
jgi:hypothetical protein